MKIYVISLPAAEARRAHARQRLDELRLEFEFVDGVDGSRGAAVFDRIDSDLYVIHTGRTPTAGEIGCYASHVTAWKQCAAEGKPVCILEDDFQLEDFFPESLGFAAELIEECGFIRLQTESRGHKYRVHDRGRFQLHRYTKMPHSTLAYVISPSAARRFIEHSRVMTGPVDVFVKRFWDHRQPLYGLTPYAVQESVMSDTSHIAGRRSSPKNLATRIRRVCTRFSWFVRRVAFNLTHYRRPA